MFLTSCDKGLGVACYEMAVHTEAGRGVAIDRDRAKSYYKKACDGGDKRGCQQGALPGLKSAWPTSSRTSARRKEGPEKLAGHARYVDDYRIPGCLHGATLRSRIARGRILRLVLDPRLRLGKLRGGDGRRHPGPERRLAHRGGPAAARRRRGAPRPGADRARRARGSRARLRGARAHRGRVRAARGGTAPRAPSRSSSAS